MSQVYLVFRNQIHTGVLTEHVVSAHSTQHAANTAINNNLTLMYDALNTKDDNILRNLQVIVIAGKEHIVNIFKIKTLNVHN